MANMIGTGRSRGWPPFSVERQVTTYNRYEVSQCLVFRLLAAFAR